MSATSFNYPAFSPQASVSVTGSTTASLTPFPASTVISVDTARVVNTGTVVAYIKFGDATVVADATTSIALLPGVIEVFDPPNSATYFSVYAPTGSPVVNVTVGVGA